MESSATPAMNVLINNAGIMRAEKLRAPEINLTDSYAQSLRYQLRGMTVEVLELIPPYVATDLMDGANYTRAMPLNQFMAEAMAILARQLTPSEICIENVRRLRFAAENGKYNEVFEGMNTGWTRAAR